MPVRTPGSISTCGTDGQYWSSMSRTSCSTDGTVDSAAAPVSRSESSPIRPSMVSANSSAVTSDFGANPPLLHDLCVLFGSRYQPDDGVGVTDVDRQQHGYRAHDPGI